MTKKGGTGTLCDDQGNLIDSYTYPLKTPDPWVTAMVLPGGEGVTKAKLEVLHGDTALASGSSYEVGKLAVGAEATTSFTIENDGGSPLTISSIELSAGGDFEERDLPSLPKPLAPGESFDIEVAFAPKSSGAKQTKLLIDSDVLADYELTLEGEAQVSEPNLQLRCSGTAVADHGSISMGSVTVRSAGTLHFAPQSASVGGGRRSSSPATTPIRAATAFRSPAAPSCRRHPRSRSTWSSGSTTATRGSSR